MGAPNVLVQNILFEKKRCIVFRCPLGRLALQAPQVASLIYTLIAWCGNVWLTTLRRIRTFVIDTMPYVEAVLH